MLAVVGIPSREARPSGSDEDTLSPELRTAGLLRPHVWVGYQWSHTGLCPGRKTSHNRYIRSFVSQSPQVGSRTGARTVGSGGLSKPFALGLSPAPMVTSPVPASSNGAGGFPALRFPDDFPLEVMRPLGRQRFRDRRPVPTPPGPVEVGLRPGKDPLPQVLPIVGGFIISPRPPLLVEECHQQGRPGRALARQL